MHIKTHLGCHVRGADAAGGDLTEGKVDQAEGGPVVVGGEAVEGLFMCVCVCVCVCVCGVCVCVCVCVYMWGVRGV